MKCSVVTFSDTRRHILLGLPSCRLTQAASFTPAERLALGEGRVVSFTNGGKYPYYKFATRKAMPDVPEHVRHMG
jgi:hypothetical protein